MVKSAAYAYCERLARKHYENFPVASRLLPARMRAHVAAVYAFARRADDFADEPGLADGERRRLLDAWQARLTGDARDAVPSELGADLIFEALHQTMAECRLPAALFTDLLDAFRQDLDTTRYSTWGELLAYCRRSANPVGRIVLRIAGYERDALDAQSDAFCTALQLTNFWQDLAVDWGRGRLYVPAEDREQAGAREIDLDAGRLTPEWRTVMRTVSDRTRALFEAGRPVCDEVSGRLRWELRLTWLGGSRVLDRLDAGNFDVHHRRPSLGPADVVPLLWGAMRWPPAPANPVTHATERSRSR